MKVLITGAAGFIGMHLSKKLLENNFQVLGLDNINDYYDVNLKKSRLTELAKYPNFEFQLCDIREPKELKNIIEPFSPEFVVHLAAQPGVRYSIDNPYEYVSNNLLGFVSILEAVKELKLKHFLFASSSSVYGKNTNMPFLESEHADHPVSLYGASKRSNELIAHSYCDIYGIPSTGLRFFTVYGPWGRPDMAPVLFANALTKGEPINVYNEGNMLRDFTFVEDVAESIYRLLYLPPEPLNEFDWMMPDPSRSSAPFRLLNIGNSNPVNLMQFIAEIETAFDKKLKINMKPIQKGDVVSTFANSERLYELVQYRPSTALSDGVKSFARWFNFYYSKGY